jgi:hypothetical protein
MNFLAHFLLARHRDSPEFHLGSIFPDFGKRAGVPLQQSAFAGLPAGQYSELLAGMQLHWYADRQFHNAELFTSGYHLWKTEFGSSISGLHRSFFLYHLLFEMWLDRVLMQANPDAASIMYQSLESVDHSVVRDFALAHTADQDHLLLQTTEDFKSRKFILQYESPEKFAGIASGVFAHATGQTRNDELRLSIMNQLPRMDLHSYSFLRKWDDFSKNCLDDWEFPY